MPAIDCDVLIVGLGPVGATLGALLTDAGVSVLAIDRDTEVYPLPRAVHFDHEIMRLFQQLGLAEAILPHTRTTTAYDFRAGDGQSLMCFDGLARTGACGWSASYMFHQPAVETALRAKLSAAPNGEIRLGRRFESLVQRDDRVEAVIHGPDGEGTVGARYLVGCDGASSGVREAIGGGLVDFAFDEPWLVIDVVAPEDSGLPDINLQICDPARPTTCVLSGPGRHRWEFMLLPGETSEQVTRDDFIRSLLAAWEGADAARIERKAVYRFHGLVAETWRSRRVLLAGDSCHQMPPFAGQGMCSGLRDAANLAWKLAAVIKGKAGEGLLDTYQSEREPHVRAYIELAIDMGRVVCTLDPAVAAARDAGMLARKAAGARALPTPASPMLGAGCRLPAEPAGALFPQPGRPSDGAGLDDVLGPGPWLIQRSRAIAAEGMTCVSVADARLAPFHESLDAWLTEQGAQSVLIRPDRYIFGAGEARDLLDAYLAALKAA